MTFALTEAVDDTRPAEEGECKDHAEHEDDPERSAEPLEGALDFDKPIHLFSRSLEAAIGLKPSFLVAVIQRTFAFTYLYVYLRSQP